ncbi:MAG: adenosylmethionine--8-amino-7-oxononanoate transaminase [Planctomycetia bacterium]
MSATSRDLPSVDAAQLRAWDDEHLWHPFTPMAAHRAEAPPIIVDADGFHLVDAEGRRYLDGTSSLWCNVHGHRVPEIDQAVRDQLGRVAHSTLLGLANEPAVRLARALVERAPAGLNKVYLSDSGATAVEAALKIAFQYHRQKPGGADEPLRDRFLALDDGYHGDTLGAVSVGGVKLFHSVYQPLLFPSLRMPAPHAYRTPPGVSRDEYLEFCATEMERTIDEHADRLAAVVVEPIVQGAAGILVHPPGYLKRLREHTRRHGILLIADEVAVGVGRLGAFAACELEQVAPDLLCWAKGLTGGYLPVAATLATDAVYDAFLGDPGDLKTFFHGHTFAGNPLGCAAALASLKRMDDFGVLDNVRRCERVLAERLGGWRDQPHVGDVRGRGMMWGVELVRDKETKEPFPYSERWGHRVTLAARERGAIVRPLGNVVVVMPAPAMPAALVHELCDVVDDSIRAVVGS